MMIARLKDRQTLLRWSPIIVLAVLACLPIHWLGTIVMLAVAAYLGQVNPGLMVAAVIGSVPLQETIMYPFIRGSMSLTQILLIGLILGWGATFWRRRIWLDAIVLWSVVVIATLVMSLVATNSFNLWAQEVYRWSAALAFYIVCRDVFRGWNRVRLALLGMTVGLGAVSLYAIYQLFEGGTPAKLIVGGVLRVFGTFGQPNPLAAYVEMTLPVLLAVVGYVVLERRRDMLPGWMLPAMIWAIGLGTVVVALTQSRGGWIGFACALGVLFLALPRKPQVAVVALGVVVLVGILITPVGRSQLSRFETVFDGETSGVRSTYDYGTGRSSLWGAAIAMIEDRPWTGEGAGEFDYHYREYTPNWFDRFPRGQAHNGWLQMGAQAGIPGIVAFTGWVIAGMLAIIGALRRAPTTFVRSLALGGLAAMVAFTVHSLVDYLNVLSLGLQLSAAMAVATSLAAEPLVVARSRFGRERTNAMASPQVAPP